MLRAGTFLQDRYEILEQIGSGGMSVVYKAKCHKLNRLVAIKVLKNEFSMDPNFISKFKMEAQAAAGLSHPNIVNVYDVVDEGELHFIVMELIEGITLKNYIIKKGHLEVKETIGISIQVAQGIMAAHEQRIIHRDIKPQNIIISKDGKVKVADFGIARAVSAQTLNSNAMGSVHYISPEQARGGYSDGRSDIYSLGITMYEMVTGHVPFEGDNTVTVALAHLEERITPPSVYNNKIPVSLERIILKCTEKKPENRYADVSGVVSHLRKALLHPHEDIVKDDLKQRSLGETVLINDEEMARIKEHKRPVERNLKPDYPEIQEFPLGSQSRSPAGSGSSGGINGGKSSKENGDEGVSRQIERLMAVGGIVVAVLVVAVLLVVASRLIGGFINPKSDNGSQVVTVENGNQSEAALDSTQVYMPEVRELSEAIAEAKLKESDLSMKRSYEYSDTIEAGYVITQDPEAGTVVSRWSSVNVVISNGSDKIDLSKLDLQSLDGTAAKSLLESRRLVVNPVEQEHETVEKGKVISYTPEQVPEGGTVTLYVSTGPHVEQSEMPNLYGLPEEEAIAQLVEAGLTPGNVTEAYSDTVAQGYVISQAVAALTSIAQGSAVDYVVSVGKEQSNVRYVASINANYDFSSLIGPGSSSAEISLMLRLNQMVDGEAQYTELMAPRTMRGDTLLPIQFSSIEGAPGVETGILEVVETDSGAVLKTYPLTFFPMS